MLLGFHCLISTVLQELLLLGGDWHRRKAPQGCKPFLRTAITRKSFFTVKANAGNVLPDVQETFAKVGVLGVDSAGNGILTARRIEID